MSIDIKSAAEDAAKEASWLARVREAFPDAWLMPAGESGELRRTVYSDRVTTAEGHPHICVDRELLRLSSLVDGRPVVAHRKTLTAEAALRVLRDEAPEAYAALLRIVERDGW